MGLGQPLTQLPGIGPKKALDFEKLGVRLQGDLLALWPRRHEDRTVITPLSSVQSGGEYTIVGSVGSIDYDPRRQVLKVTVTDGLFALYATFFHARWLARQVQPGTRILLQGRVEYWGRRLAMTHPHHEVLSPGEEPARGLIPIYPLAGDLKQRVVQQVMSLAIPYLAPQAFEPLPHTLREQEDLLERPQAIMHLHWPPNKDAFEKARRRLVFDEFLKVSLAVMRMQQWDRGIPGVKQNPDGPISQKFLDLLPFQLTPGQSRAWASIREDLCTERPMTRLLQGDVGSGKTVVAILAMLAALDAEHQAAFMAPTELLAEQQWRVLNTFTEPLGVQVGLLTGQDAGQAARVRDDIALGRLSLVVGTQALLSPSVQFQKLGLVVIDEQHRFGVRQRAHLAQKGYFPDLLVMTATPIPRTLALTLYGDLDLSQIDGLPPGRLPITTIHLSYADRRTAYESVRQAVRRGEQAYVVCPLVNENEELDVTAATVLADGMRRIPGWRVGLVHGQLPSKEKTAVMEAYRTHQIDVLVATTIVEVGVDVPNATVMVIEEADRFGLAQLHQLRGRVGRGSKPATCYLLADPKTEDAEQRMDAMVRWSDGLKLAEQDLKIRGPGEILGLRQHGLAGFELADPVADLLLMEHVRDIARQIVDADPRLEQPEHQTLKKWVDEAIEDALPTQVLH